MDSEDRIWLDWAKGSQDSRFQQRISEYWMILLQGDHSPTTTTIRVLLKQQQVFYFVFLLYAIIRSRRRAQGNQQKSSPEQQRRAPNIPGSSMVPKSRSRLNTPHTGATNAKRPTFRSFSDRHSNLGASGRCIHEVWDHTKVRYQKILLTSVQTVLGCTKGKTGVHHQPVDSCSNRRCDWPPLRNIKSPTFSFQSQKHEPHALDEGKRRFHQTGEHKNAKCPRATLKPSKTQSRCWSIPEVKLGPTLDLWKGPWHARRWPWKPQPTSKSKSVSSLLEMLT